MIEKIKATKKWIQEREKCFNHDHTPYQVTHAEVTAFLCGWDAAMKEKTNANNQ